MFFAVKVVLSGLVIAVVSTVAKRYPGFGALIASLPLHVQSTFWFVLPSVPMFVLIPGHAAQGLGVWPMLAAGCLVTVLLDSLMGLGRPRLGLPL